MDNRNRQLSRDNANWEELFGNLLGRPEDEAFELLRRLRLSKDPLEVLDFVRHGDLLLSCGIPSARNERESQIDAMALEHAPIKVPAKPWTLVAGDGIVSELVSAWFKWDDAFGYPFVDRDAFFTSEPMRQRSLVLKTDFRARFYADAKKHFDLDQSASITNVQGLWLLFTFSCAAGTDRAGSMYRFAAYEMLKRMRLKSKYSKLRDDVPEQALEKKAIAKLYWGIFSFESLASQAFLQLSMMEIPWMDSPYSASLTGATKDDNLDMFDRPYESGTTGPPMVVGARYATSQLGKLLNEVMEYITGDISDIGGAADLQRRTELLTLLSDFGQSLPPSLQIKDNFVHQNCFLWIFFNCVGFNILRNLDPGTVVAGSTVKEHIIRHCELDTSIMERAMEAEFFTEWSVVVVCGVLNVLPHLVPLLQDPQAQSIFSRSCVITHALSNQLPILRILIRGVQGMAVSLGQRLPTTVQPVFQNLPQDDGLVGDVPTAYQLPHPERMRNVILDESADATNVGIDLSLVIAKWSAISAA
ncbi:MAG: hypothetical protein M1822_008317 [Bathelium mastoideum]|nr:MAG: hypothetical protein M1822_008317 [Bathelium mastoideum]